MLPWRRICPGIDAMPRDTREFSGVAMMGGPMSAYDDLPWIAPMLDLIRDAAHAGVPLLGHCLGGQLMSMALGGTVSRHPVKEIGWHEVTVADNAEAAHWFGDLKRFTAFEWHGDAFTLPAGATGLLSSAYCANQAFSMGKHLGMQCHVEMDDELVQDWCESGEKEIAVSNSPAVQSTAEIRSSLETRLAALNAIADRLYTRWMEGLV
jgi:GMP synthase-like glutamine amidotransferase